ncbi:C1-like protein [Corchorus olitorius]|uniref:C1-like protein n=1 Tax=Corchorus olitorius TaxID=93759 RepID=A0A1R3H2H0_9ROSI|nr:C1-like protein [Corchorus olitorius]
MGKLSHNLHIQHFSHPHLLELTNQTLNISPCSACNLPPSGWMYTCKPCNFSLHTSCSQLPQLITHPAHPGHSLTLLPTPAYPVGFFSCDACGQRGHGFSYHCSQCDFDIHSVCASKPLSLVHQSHPCQLQLFFYPPYQTKGFSCDVCHQIGGSNHWLYRCSVCSFDVHLSCATTAATYNTNTTRQVNPQFQVQPMTQFPGASNLQYGNMPVQMNTQYPVQMNTQYPAQMMNNQYPAQMMNNQYPAQMNNQCYMQQQQNQNNGNPLVDAAIQGFVEGAAQQAGQDFMQRIQEGQITAINR